MRSKNQLALLLIATVFFSACSAAKQSISKSALSQMIGKKSYPSDSILSVYEIDSSTGKEKSFLGTVQQTNGGFELPPSVKSWLGSGGGTARCAAYVLKAYSPTSSGTDGDFYYEAPILSETVEITGATTALSVAIRKSGEASGRCVKMTRSTWENLIFVLDSNCSNCKNQSAATAWNVIKTIYPALNGQITSGDPGFQISSAVMNSVGTSAPTLMAYSSPPVISNSSALLSYTDGTYQNFRASLYQPYQSTVRIKPSSWCYTGTGGVANQVASSTDNASIFIQYLSATELASATFLAQNYILQSIGVALDCSSASLFTFPIQVSQGTNKPAVRPIVTQSFQSNHQGSYNLTTMPVATPSVFDPNGTALTFSLISGPTGLSLSSAGVISWNPTSQQVGLTQVSFSVTNAVGLANTGGFSINVGADILPTVVASNVPVFTEAQQNTIVLNLVDSDVYTYQSLATPTPRADADLLMVTCVSGCSGLKPSPAMTGNPFPSAGWPSPTAYSYQATPVPSGMRSVSIAYTPDFRECIGGAAGSTCVRNLEFRADYITTVTDASGAPLLRNVPLETTTLIVPVTINNVDDPPVWIPLPTTMNLALSEPTPNPGFPGLNQTKVATPGPNSSISTIGVANSYNTITYSIINLTPVNTTPGSSGGDCNWILSGFNPTTAQITATPNYKSPDACTFNIRATTNNGLFADSSLVTFTIQMMNSPILANPAPFATPIFKTGVDNFQDISGLFSYFNLGQGSPRGIVNYRCVNCAYPYPTPTPTIAIPSLVFTGTCNAPNATTNLNADPGGYGLVPLFGSGSPVTAQPTVPQFHYQPSYNLISSTSVGATCTVSGMMIEATDLLGNRAYNTLAATVKLTNVPMLVGFNAGSFVSGQAQPGYTPLPVPMNPAPSPLPTSPASVSIFEGEARYFSVETLCSGGVCPTPSDGWTLKFLGCGPTGAICNNDLSTVLVDRLSVDTSFMPSASPPGSAVAVAPNTSPAEYKSTNPGNPKGVVFHVSAGKKAGTISNGGSSSRTYALQFNVTNSSNTNFSSTRIINVVVNNKNTVPTQINLAMPTSMFDGCNQNPGGCTVTQSGVVTPSFTFPASCTNPSGTVANVTAIDVGFDATIMGNSSTNKNGNISLTMLDPDNNQGDGVTYDLATFYEFPPPISPVQRLASSSGIPFASVKFLSANCLPGSNTYSYLTVIQATDGRGGTLCTPVRLTVTNAAVGCSVQNW